MFSKSPLIYDARLKRLKLQFERELELMKKGEPLPMRIWPDGIFPGKNPNPKREV